MHSNRIDSLRRRHAQISAQLDAEIARPSPDLGQVRALKKAKLRLKDEIAALTREPKVPA